MVDSTYCKPPSSGASTLAAVPDGFRSCSEPLSGFVGPSHSLNGSSSVGPMYSGAMDDGAVTIAPPILSLSPLPMSLPV
ncbi:hypothetical protein Nepgr_015858 [Nepenthes gracilis]|uniref:Uncharacterized protein n=1 Tax=Nepenthes gracilis TaxID=150966 RepID=A0AAD3SMS5_NEPGR|nr:hypothetical protein Nepgr_015858 [Nepenthes gracilis]